MLAFELPTRFLFPESLSGGDIKQDLEHQPAIRVAGAEPASPADALEALRSATASRHTVLDSRMPLARVQGGSLPSGRSYLRYYRDHLRLLRAWLTPLEAWQAGYEDGPYGAPLGSAPQGSVPQDSGPHGNGPRVDAPDGQAAHAYAAHADAVHGEAAGGKAAGGQAVHVDAPRADAAHGKAARGEAPHGDAAPGDAAQANAAHGDTTHGNVPRNNAPHAAPQRPAALPLLRRLPAIEADLGHAGMPAADSALAFTEQTWPAHASPAYRWGAAYVVEGSQLGASVLYRRLAGPLAPHPLRYLQGEGPPGPRWQAFIAALRAQVRTPAEILDARAGACAAFDRLLALLQANPALAAPPPAGGSASLRPAEGGSAGLRSSEGGSASSRPFEGGSTSSRPTESSSASLRAQEDAAALRNPSHAMRQSGGADN